jgi:GNAT superfamily N-acetyltransferase
MIHKTSLGAVIRPVVSRDQDVITGLWQALSDYHVALDPRLPGTTIGAAQRYAQRLIERLDDPFTRALVAEVDGRVVGYILGAVLDLHPDLFEHVDSGFIADIFVDPAYRQRGIARQLVQALNHWFVEQGVKQVEWQVAATNAQGIQFWEAMGGKPLMIRMRLDINDADSE